MIDLRPINLADFEPIPTVEQPRPTIQWISIDSLFLDDSYQRRIERRGRQNIQSIAQEFSWGRFTPVLVSPVGVGRFAIIDGQHRTHAAALCGNTQVPAMIVEMTREEQASAFSWVNGRVTAVSTFHIYKAALAAQEKWALGSEAAVHASGCSLMTSNSSTANKKPGQVYCIALIRQYSDSGRASVVRVGLSAITQSVNAEWNEYYSASILRPWFSVVAEFDLKSVNFLVEFLNANPFEELLRGIEKMRETQEYYSKSRAALLNATLTALMRRFIETNKQKLQGG